MPVLKPSAFHGFGKKGPYFEGWYFKHISRDGNHRWSIIPGVYVGKNPADSHSFIQFLNGVDGKSWYIDFPFSDFHADHDRFRVRIADNEFSSDFINLEINREDFTTEGRLEYHGIEPWPVTLISPGMMGPFAWVPGMQCYHGVVSLDHSIEGSVQINGKKVDFSGGRGYMEKDWGKTMPNAWIWNQSNNFSRDGISLTLSVADIPYGPLSFNGFIAGLLLDGKLHRFTTYTGAKVEHICVTEGDVNITFANKQEVLEVRAKKGKTAGLQAPTTIQMDRRIKETLSAEVDTHLSQKHGDSWKEIFQDTGRYAGLEIVGKLDLDKF